MERRRERSDVPIGDIARLVRNERGRQLRRLEGNQNFGVCTPKHPATLIAMTISAMASARFFMDFVALILALQTRDQFGHYPGLAENDHQHSDTGNDGGRIYK